MLSKNKERKLIALYPHLDDEVIAKQLGIGLWMVRKRAEELGLEKEEAEEWCRVHIDYLVRNYSHFSNETISEEVGRSKMEVEHYAFRMGLSKNPDFFSNITITDEEKELVKSWNDEYNKDEHGSSRGNYVLGKILEKAFPMSQVVAEYPIGSLRLDFYIPRMFLGFEFDGIQHKEYNKFFYETKADFHKAQNRDYEKSSMCENMGISIVRFAHDEPLSISLVRAKINEVL